MKKLIAKLLALALLLALLAGVQPPAACAAETPPAREATAETATIKKYGNVSVSIRCDEILEAGYAFGDVLTVEFLGRTLELPFCSSYSDVDSGSPGVFAKPDEEFVVIAINMGDFATTYGIAVKTTFADKTYEWSYAEGVTGPVRFRFSMKEAGGYYDEYVMHQLSYTNAREDYPDLTDAQYANFRAVVSTGLGAGVLCRSSSPIDPEYGRARYADAALRDAGVTVVMDLADAPETAVGFAGYASSYYATTDWIALNMGMDFFSDDFRTKLAEGLRFFAEHPGVYAIHCKEGKARTGFVCAVLECLMGATYDEVAADYMCTYENYYAVTWDDPRCATILNSNIVKTLSTAFGVCDPASADLAAGAEAYLLGIGLSEAELAALKTNLAAPVTLYSDVSSADGCFGAVRFAGAKQLMNGVGGGAFAPDAAATREQGMTVLARLGGTPLCTLDEGVAWAVQSGVSDGTERGAALTREQFAVMLYRCAPDGGAGAGAEADLGDCAVHDWALDAMRWACAAGILAGADGAAEALTRAEMAAMLMRYCFAAA